VVIAGAAALLLAGGLGAFILTRNDQGASGVVSPEVAKAGTVRTSSETLDGVVEASALTAEGDQLPFLVAGEAPVVVLGELALRPTIVCRLLIDARGNVIEASVYRSRSELATLEADVLAAVRGFRFAPAQRNGQSVAVWINWPVELGR
jgi:TonB family protein